MTTAPIEIGSDLRNLILRYRRDHTRWPGTKKGLSQAEAAERANISTAWWRQIENGYVDSAGAVTLADMCNVLGIEVEIIRMLGYVQIADAMDASVIEAHESIPDHIIDSKARLRRLDPSPEAHIKATPGLDDTTIELLLDTLHQVRRRGEPLGADIWRRRR